MNKKLVNVLTVILMLVMILSVASSVFALTPSEVTSGTDVQGASEIGNVGRSIVGILQTVGIVLSVIILIILGIKYMMGSAEEKAEYKKTFIPYLIGALLLFAASAFAKTIYNWVTNIKV